MIKNYKFWTKDGIAVVLKPETPEQHDQVFWMGRMWILNRLWNCGAYYIVEFAEQHGIRYSYQFVVELNHIHYS